MLVGREVEEKEKKKKRVWFSWGGLRFGNV